jgi:hypothetical protein
MKTLFDQIMPHQPAITPKGQGSRKHFPIIAKFIFVLYAFKCFFIDLGIDYKKALKKIAIALFFLFAVVLLGKLALRALDIEANAQANVYKQHNAELKSLGE